MILGNSEIKRLIEDKKLIEEHEEQNVQGAGVDFRARTFYRPSGDTKVHKESRTLPEISEISGDTVSIKPNELILVETMEKVNMPSDIAARILPRSTLCRCGVYLLTAFVDPGFSGRLTVGLKNMSNHSFELEKGARIMQVMFEKTEGDTVDYDGRYQGGKVV